MFRLNLDKLLLTAFGLRGWITLLRREIRSWYKISCQRRNSAWRILTEPSSHILLGCLWHAFPQQSPSDAIIMAFYLRRVATTNYPTQLSTEAFLLSFMVRFRRCFSDSKSEMNTADLSDAYNDILQYVEPNIFRNYGGKTKFGGMISTVKCHEDNVLVKQALSEEGNKRILVVDAGGSLRRGMLGDNLAAMAVKNNWTGVIMYGCIRDSEEIGKMELGVAALGTMPLKSIKKGQGDRDIPVRFGGVTFTPGHFIFSDLDGIIVSPKELTLPPPKL